MRFSQLSLLFLSLATVTLAATEAETTDIATTTHTSSGTDASGSSSGAFPEGTSSFNSSESSGVSSGAHSEVTGGFDPMCRNDANSDGCRNRHHDGDTQNTRRTGSWRTPWARHFPRTNQEHRPTCPPGQKCDQGDPATPTHTGRPDPMA